MSGHKHFYRLHTVLRSGHSWMMLCRDPECYTVSILYRRRFR